LSNTAVDLGEPGDRFPTPGEYVGYEVLDPLGQKIGTADELFVNANDEPEYVRLRMGFLGLKSVLLPVETVAVDKQRRTLVLH
jgi:hypothetical protein